MKGFLTEEVPPEESLEAVLRRAVYRYALELHAIDVLEISGHFKDRLEAGAHENFRWTLKPSMRELSERREE